MSSSTRCITQGDRTLHQGYTKTSNTPHQRGKRGKFFYWECQCGSDIQEVEFTVSLNRYSHLKR